MQIYGFVRGKPTGFAIDRWKLTDGETHWNCVSYPNRSSLLSAWGHFGNAIQGVQCRFIEAWVCAFQYPLIHDVTMLVDVKLNVYHPTNARLF